MADETRPALTPEQWEAKDYRQSARDLDRWAAGEPAASGDDATEYAAKLGKSGAKEVMVDATSGKVISRTHETALMEAKERKAK
jgi:hypothetical protein